MPRIDAKDYDEGKIIIKPRDDWRNDIFNWIIGFAASLVSFIVLKYIPYVGVLFFMGGFLGMVMSAMYLFRAIVVYRHYDDLFTEENINKLVK